MRFGATLRRSEAMKRAIVDGVASHANDPLG